MSSGSGGPAKRIVLFLFLLLMGRCNITVKMDDDLKSTDRGECNRALILWIFEAMGAHLDCD